MVNVSNYLKHNIVKTGDNKYDVEVALRSNKDINVSVENGMLTIESKTEDKSKDKDGEVIYKGISKDTLKNRLQLVMSR